MHLGGGSPAPYTLGGIQPQARGLGAQMWGSPPPPHPTWQGRGWEIPALPPHTRHGAQWVGRPGGWGVLQWPTTTNGSEVPRPILSHLPIICSRVAGGGGCGSGSGASLPLPRHASGEVRNPLAPVHPLCVQGHMIREPASHLGGSNKGKNQEGGSGNPEPYPNEGANVLLL